MKMASDTPDTVPSACSFCGKTITKHHVLIQYETTTGERGLWAECPSCGEIVDPIDDQ